MRSISPFVRRSTHRAECCRLSGEMAKRRPLEPELQVRFLRADKVACPIAFWWLCDSTLCGPKQPAIET